MTNIYSMSARSLERSTNIVLSAEVLVKHHVCSRYRFRMITQDEAIQNHERYRPVERLSSQPTPKVRIPFTGVSVTIRRAVHETSSACLARHTLACK